jgi:N-hydroxyarylamine O-acetyltransferase
VQFLIVNSKKMKKNYFYLNAYLQRLNYSGEIVPTIDRLEALHRAQIYTIPFENFDILLGRGISLDPERLFDKLVSKARGGYCFELNGLFLRVLKAIGFNARALLARVHLTGLPSGRGHQISLVTLQGRQWIADVGFGSQSLRAPIPFELDEPTTHDGLTFRLMGAGNFGIMLQTLTDDQWIDLYSFDLEYVYPNDILYGNHFTSTHPSAFFTSARVAALPLNNGSVTLFNRTLKKITVEFEQVWELEEGQAYLDALKNHFGIELDTPYDKLRPLPKSD